MFCVICNVIVQFWDSVRFTFNLGLIIRLKILMFVLWGVSLHFRFLRFFIFLLSFLINLDFNWSLIYFGKDIFNMRELSVKFFWIAVAPNPKNYFKNFSIQLRFWDCIQRVLNFEIRHFVTIFDPKRFWVYQFCPSSKFWLLYNGTSYVAHSTIFWFQELNGNSFCWIAAQR